MKARERRDRRRSNGPRSRTLEVTSRVLVAVLALSISLAGLVLGAVGVMWIVDGGVVPGSIVLVFAIAITCAGASLASQAVRGRLAKPSSGNSIGVFFGGGGGGDGGGDGGC